MPPAVRVNVAYDAVQLATARTVAGVDPRCRRFAAFDTEPRTAAAEGFELVPARCA